MKTLRLSILSGLTLFSGVDAQGQKLLPSDFPTSLTGIVKTYDNQPAAGYLVNIAGASKSSTPREQAQTDKEGRFTVIGLKYGEYVIALHQETIDSQYIDGLSSFYVPDPPRAQLSAAMPSRQMTITLEPPNRILTGTVISAADGSPLLATVQVEVAGNPDRFIRFGTTRAGAFRALIPPNTSLMMKTSALEYAPVSQALGPIDLHTDPNLEIRLPRTVIGQGNLPTSPHK